MSFISLVCRALVFVLWLFHVFPVAIRSIISQDPDSTSQGLGLHRWKGRGGGGKHSGLAVSAAQPLVVGATLLLCGPPSPSLTLEENVCPALCSWRPLSLPGYSYPCVTLSKSLPTTCPLVVAWTQSSQLLLSYPCLWMLCEAGPSREQHTVYCEYIDVTDLCMV